ncbi:DUF3429 domain-containing protein [Thalassorhabdomicrobium marinisediminis]|uniref:DUF3429 domain-containing protein n=1 Tax=Thalassorhabdomicrobium marinisediminis TaxID=2170577 RepID=A0A2T7FW29_9RHOB|nr:DUF3429 domain-containing protein [Thalassorhabdomicrobium marinisediminis]PVA06364.1 DUF3429 domain-containing protein [Thalassorhabdomicrobium marinisediminis]
MSPNTATFLEIPRPALILGLAGLLPFVWGVVTLYSPALAALTTEAIGPRFSGPYVGLAYGTVILSFMSGVLWGFAANTSGAQAAVGYALSTLPALWAFFMVGGGPVSAAINLITGFLALLALDYVFWRWGLAPRWWMALRCILTGGVIMCLLPITL